MWVDLEEVDTSLDYQDAGNDLLFASRALFFSRTQNLHFLRNWLP
jgi:hypothetical protein